MIRALKPLRLKTRAPKHRSAPLPGGDSPIPPCLQQLGRSAVAQKSDCSDPKSSRDVFMSSSGKGRNSYHGCGSAVLLLVLSPLGGVLVVVQVGGAVWGHSTNLFPVRQQRFRGPQTALLSLTTHELLLADLLKTYIALSSK